MKDKSCQFDQGEPWEAQDDWPSKVADPVNRYPMAPRHALAILEEAGKQMQSGVDWRQIVASIKWWHVPAEMLALKLSAVSIRAGDRLVIQAPGRLGDRAIGLIREQIRDLFPGCEALVLEDGLSVGGAVHVEDKPIERHFHEQSCYDFDPTKLIPTCGKGQ